MHPQTTAANLWWKEYSLAEQKPGDLFIILSHQAVLLYFPEQISESSLLDRSGVSLESKPFIGVALFKCPPDGTLERVAPNLHHLSTMHYNDGKRQEGEVCELTVGWTRVYSPSVVLLLLRIYGCTSTSTSCTKMATHSAALPPASQMAYFQCSAATCQHWQLCLPLPWCLALSLKIHRIFFARVNSSTVQDAQKCRRPENQTMEI